MASETAGTILKILSGVQSGMDVALLDGDYTLGSGDDDDIQLFDVSLKPRHATLSIRPGKMEIAGAAGQLRTRNGLALEAGGTAQEIEPLDIVTAGTTRFALGPRTANWASITEAERNPDTLYTAPQKKSASGRPARARWRPWQAAVAVCAVLVLVLVGVVLTSRATPVSTSDEAVADNELTIVETALDSFDFRDKLNLRQELDGVLYLTGFVDEPVQRRAVYSAVGNTGIPVRIRIAVLDSIRNEVTNLLEEEKFDVSFDLSDTGDLTLKGVILDADRAAALPDIVRDQVVGIASIKSEIRSAPTLLADTEALADKSQILPLVLLRLDGSLIEASGVVPTEKVDAWVGFLQAYASQLAPIIPLRSLVLLQNPDGTPADPTAQPDTGLFLGAGATPGRDIPIDVNRLQAGNFELANVFVSEDRDPLPGTVPANRNEVATIPTAGGPRIDLLGMLAGPKPAPIAEPPVAVAEATSPAEDTTDATEDNTSVVDEQAAAPALADPAPLPVEPVAPPAEVPPVAPVAPTVDIALPRIDLGGMARNLITSWVNGTLDDSADGTVLKKDLETLQNHDLGEPSTAPATSLAQRYAPLLANAAVAGNDGQRCWQDSRLTRQSVAGALFWLDLLSVSTELSLTDLDEASQGLVLEAALSPEWTAHCAEAATGHPVQSTYLYEVARNPDFVRYIARDIAAFPIDVAGVSMAGERYIQTRAGRKMREGSAPDQTSRLLLVGELGAAFQRDNGYSTLVFDTSLNWVVR